MVVAAIAAGLGRLGWWVLKRYGWKTAVAFLALKEVSDTKDQIVRAWQRDIPNADAEIASAIAQLQRDTNYELPHDVLSRLAAVLAQSERGIQDDAPAPPDWDNPEDETERLTRGECIAWGEFNAECC